MTNLCKNDSEDIDVFLITSVINAGKKPWSYTNARSIYTTQERFEQTIKSIQSIRNLNDNSIIVLSECSNIDETITNTLKKLTDVYINSYDNNIIKNICTNSSLKGYGEAMQSIIAIKKIREMNIKFKRIFKLSGRYWLTQSFNKKNFSLTEYSFNKILNNSNCHPTVLYSIPYCSIQHYEDILIKSINIYKHGNPIGYEEILPPLCQPKTIIDGVGVAGFVAVNGQFYSTP